ncbi:MAG: hypothetical protein ACOC3Z_02135 [Nanoarchaeota archaeon]
MKKLEKKARECRFHELSLLWDVFEKQNYSIEYESTARLKYIRYYLYKNKKPTLNIIGGYLE